jgi:hypothetical protein
VNLSNKSDENDFEKQKNKNFKKSATKKQSSNSVKSHSGNLEEKENERSQILTRARGSGGITRES